jgi:hypothetical protein
MREKDTNIAAEGRAYDQKRTTEGNQGRNR